MEEVFIHTPEIQLDQLLKWMGIVDSGGQARLLIDEGIVWVEGKRVTERRKKVRPGTVLRLGGIEYLVRFESGEPE